MHVQDFAEKPKGAALEEMKVDTTILGELVTAAMPSKRLVEDRAQVTHGTRRRSVGLQD